MGDVLAKALLFGRNCAALTRCHWVGAAIRPQLRRFDIPRAATVTPPPVNDA